MITAIILAAGKSERMGRPKALLRLGEKTFLERVLGTVRDAGISHTVVVAGHHYREIAQAFPSLPLTFNPNYEMGMGTSVQAGIRALGPDASAAGVFLVDHPMVGPDTVVALLQQLQSGRITLPVYAGRRGHPVFFAVELFPEILALGPEQGLNAVVRRDSSRVIEVPAAGPGILEDIDTPEELEKLLRERK